MSKFQHDVMLRAVKFLDVILMTLPFAACWFLYYGQRIQTPLDAAGHAAVLALYAVLFIVLGKVYDAFLMAVYRARQGVRRLPDVDAARVGAGVQPDPGGHGGGRAAVHCDLPAERKAVQSAARHRGHCGAVGSSGAVVRGGPQVVLRGVPAPTHGGNLRHPPRDGEAHPGVRPQPEI